MTQGWDFKPASTAGRYEYEESLQFTPAQVWAHFAREGAAMNESVLPAVGLGLGL